MANRINNFEEYQAQYKLSVENPEGFWAAQAEDFVWKEKWDKVLDWNFETPDIKWYSGGELNITENCLDRHLATKGDQDAIIWEPNDPREKVVKLTYKELHQEVCKFANVLAKHSVIKGDRVCLYMPMVQSWP